MTETFNFEIEESKDGLKILRIHKDNKKIYIGSKYNMKKKIDELLENATDIKENSIVIIFGIGTGKYIEELYNRKKNIKIIIFEPNNKLVSYVKDNPNEYKILSKENVYLLDIKNFEEGYLYLKTLIDEVDLNNIVYKPLLSYDCVYKDTFIKFNSLLKNVFNDIQIRRNTRLFFHKRWFDAFLNNLKYMINAFPVNYLEGAYKNIPAIIVSAGPSLNKNIDVLKDVNKDMLILSGGRTLKPLINNNIEPDLIGVVDSGNVSYELVKEYIDKTKAPLLFYEGTNEDVVKDHKGKKIIFSQNPMINDIFDMNVKDLSSGGSIAHDLTSAAIYLGCNPIIFIGQDLAYTEDKYHADIAVNQFNNIKENNIKSDKEKDKYIYIEDINGNKVKTSKVLDNFRRELEIIIKYNKDITFINATEGGAKIKGTIQMTLKDAIDKYKQNKCIDFIEDVEKVKINSNVCEKTIKVLDKVIKEDKEIIKNCKEALKTIKLLSKYVDLDKNFNINECIKKLDGIDKKIKNSYESLDILMSIIYPTIYAILTGDKPKDNKEIIENNKFLYKSILGISEQVLNPIKYCKEDIEKMEFTNA